MGHDGHVRVNRTGGALQLSFRGGLSAFRKLAIAVPIYIFIFTYYVFIYIQSTEYINDIV